MFLLYVYAMFLPLSACATLLKLLDALSAGRTQHVWLLAGIIAFQLALTVLAVWWLRYGALVKQLGHLRDEMQTLARRSRMGTETPPEMQLRYDRLLHKLTFHERILRALTTVVFALAWWRTKPA